jgi:hypothetical protein
MAKYKLLTDLTMNRILVFKTGDIVDANEQPINKYGDVFAKITLSPEKTKMLNGIDSLNFIVDSKIKRNIQGVKVDSSSTDKSSSNTISNTISDTFKDIDTTGSTSSSSNIIPFSLEKTARKMQVGWTLAGWAIFGFIAYKFWNKSTIWKVVIAGLGISNAYYSYKAFSGSKSGSANKLGSTSSTSSTSSGSTSSGSTTSLGSSSKPSRKEQEDFMVKENLKQGMSQADTRNSLKNFNDDELLLIYAMTSMPNATPDVIKAKFGIDANSPKTQQLMTSVANKMFGTIA